MPTALLGRVQLRAIESTLKSAITELRIAMGRQTREEIAANIQRAERYLNEAKRRFL